MHKEPDSGQHWSTIHMVEVFMFCTYVFEGYLIKSVLYGAWYLSNSVTVLVIVYFADFILWM